MDPEKFGNSVMFLSLVGNAVSPSRPTISQSVGRSGGQGKRAAARSHAQPFRCGEHGEHGEHWTLMDAATGVTLDQAGCLPNFRFPQSLQHEGSGSGKSSKSVTATPSIAVILLTPGSSNQQTVEIPPKDTRRTYPKIGIIDGGLGAPLADWIIERWDILADEDVDLDHGTFIGGSLSPAVR